MHPHIKGYSNSFRPLTRNIPYWASVMLWCILMMHFWCMILLYLKTSVFIPPHINKKRAASKISSRESVFEKLCFLWPFLWPLRGGGRGGTNFPSILSTIVGIFWNLESRKWRFQGFSGGIFDCGRHHQLVFYLFWPPWLNCTHSGKNSKISSPWQK